MLFFDDFSRMVWVTFLEEKYEMFFGFKAFKDLLENQSGHKIKCLHTDNGG